MRLRRRHPRADRRPFRAATALGRFVSILFAALFALQGAVAVSHTHLRAADAGSASISQTALGDDVRSPDDDTRGDGLVCEECLAAAAFAHAPPAGEPALVQPVPVEVRVAGLIETPAPRLVARATRGARAPPTLL